MAEDEKLHETPRDIKAEDILDTEHIPADIPPENIEFLKGLIDSFNTSTAKLRNSYTTLREKVESLNSELEETNSELSISLTEQERLSNYLTNILESLSSGVLVIDTEGKINLFNRGAEAITGVSVEEAVNRPYNEVMGADAPDELTPLWTLSTGEGHSQIEKTVLSKEGKTVPVGCSISPLVNTSGEIIGAVEIFMDMTRLKALEEELAEKEKLAALGQMAATMAHKIRNPLGGIAGFAGLLDLEMKDSENGRRLVGKITEGVDKLDRIVTSLLSYTSELNLEPHMTDLTELMEDIVNTAKMNNNSMNFLLNVPDGPVLVEFDMEQFRGAVQSIIRNAVEAVENDGAVDITVIPTESGYLPSNRLSAKLLNTLREKTELLNSRLPGAILLITDSGKGMSPEVKEQLFVPFFTTKENGIGLGLASARKIIEGHHGEIVIKSEKNAGTAVGVVLKKKV